MLAIKYGGLHISGSPAVINVSGNEFFKNQLIKDAGRAHPEKCIVFGEGLITGRLGEKSEFTLVLKDIYGNLRKDGDFVIFEVKVFYSNTLG